ncbi:hypothetical protein B0O80DRAFT_432690 [Mortierella sp. GBAus27b]|nr:hypothetical protein BGX31_007014 [Mortierella sp. GBA43]KAI8363093.1 hypothetical protein B0O80DRAFT_432690 [Mortierella sp. GBAus27b]
MSINWVLMSPDGKDIVPLDNETIFLRQQGVRFELDCSNGGYPGAGANYLSKSGTLMLTNQRIVYLCEQPTSFFSSASLPVHNVQDSKLSQSWFSLSAPVFKAVVMPVAGGGLTQPGRLSITFTTGDIGEFDAQYRSLRERCQELDGAAPQHLEQLPVYAPPSSSTANAADAGPSTTLTAPIPQPLPPPVIPHIEPPALDQPSSSPPPLPSSSSNPPPPPQPQTTPVPAPPSHEIPSDLPPSYDEIR